MLSFTYLVQHQTVPFSLIPPLPAALPASPVHWGKKINNFTHAWTNHKRTPVLLFISWHSSSFSCLIKWLKSINWIPRCTQWTNKINNKLQGWTQGKNQSFTPWWTYRNSTFSALIYFITNVALVYIQKK